MISAALADEIEEKMRPVGQVVKTEASHAFNIGSNPVRVTKKKGTHSVPFFLVTAVLLRKTGPPQAAFYCTRKGNPPHFPLHTFLSPRS